MSNGVDKVNWQEFDKLHVIRRLRQLVGKWWNIQINFTDQKGFIRGVPEGKFFNPVNSVCQMVTKDKTGFAGCKGTASQTTVEAMSAKKPKLSRCHAGFSTLSVPIRVNGEFLGSVFGDGFVVAETEVEQKTLIKNYITRQFKDVKDVESYLSKLPVLNERDVSYLQELIEIVVAEIVMTEFSLSEVQKKVVELEGEIGSRYGFDNMIGKAAPMQDLYKLLDRVCDSPTTVLVQGENGTGKELIAKALHYNSRRKQKKMYSVNCGAFNENLLESELFGHVKGAFTGAIKEKKGLFDAADNSTLFLDEIGDTSMTMQVKLLRVLQDGTFTPVGGTAMKKTDVRIVAATNKNLQQMVKDGTFREDLFYRLNVINIAVPALKDRKEDIPLLAEHFLKAYAKNSGSPEKKLSKEVLQLFMNYEWPGNVRQLENEVERLCVLAGNDKELVKEFMSPAIKERAGGKQSSYRVEGLLKEALESLEREMIMEGLKRTRWNKSKLAKELGISRAGLIMKVEKYGFDKRNA